MRDPTDEVITGATARAEELFDELVDSQRQRPARGRLMRSGRIDADVLPTLRTKQSTVVRRATKPSIACSDADNPFWNSSGVHIESTRSWGSISADIVSRAAGKVVWRSDCYRIVYALSDFLGTVRNDNGPEQDSPLLRDNFSFSSRWRTL